MTKRDAAFGRVLQEARRDATTMAEHIVWAFKHVLDGTVELTEQDNAYVITVTPADRNRHSVVLTLNYSVRRVDSGRLER